MCLLEPLGRVRSAVFQVEPEDVIVGVGGFAREGAEPEVVQLQLTVIAAQRAYFTANSVSNSLKRSEACTGISRGVSNFRASGTSSCQ